jgi:hypothetical protein
MLVCWFVLFTVLLSRTQMQYALLVIIFKIRVGSIVTSAPHRQLDDVMDSTLVWRHCRQNRPSLGTQLHSQASTQCFLLAIHAGECSAEVLMSRRTDIISAAGLASLAMLLVSISRSLVLTRYRASQLDCAAWSRLTQPDRRSATNR